MTAKFTVLGSTTLATSSSTVTFSSIPGGYKDLVCSVEISEMASGYGYTGLRFNGSSASDYSRVTMGGESSTTTSQSGTGTYIDFTMYYLGVGQTGVFQINALDYSSTNKHKSVLCRYSSADRGGVQATAGRWASTSAVTSLSIITSNSFAAGSTFRLLGVN